MGLWFDRVLFYTTEGLNHQANSRRMTFNTREMYCSGDGACYLSVSLMTRKQATVPGELPVKLLVAGKYAL